MRNIVGQSASAFGNIPFMDQDQIMQMIQEQQRNIASKGGAMRYFNPEAAKTVSYTFDGTRAATQNPGALKSMFGALKSNPTLGKIGAVGKGALKAAPYIGLGLMGAQGIGDVFETGSLGRSNEELAGDIGLMNSGTPMVNEFMDPTAIKDLEKLLRKGNLKEDSAMTSGIKGAASELPGAALTTLLFTLLSGGAALPLGLAFGAGQLGLGATKGLKEAEQTEASKLQNLYAQLAEAQRMSKASRMPATQNYNMR